MKIRISDMLDNAAEVVEMECNYNNVVDSRRVKEIVFQRIYRSQRKRIREQGVVALIAVLGLSVISIGAKTLLRSAGVIGINQEDILQPQIGIKVDEEDIYDYETEFNIQSDLISEKYLYENGVPIAKYIAEVVTDEKNKLPKCYVDNGAMLIFANADNTGWYVGADTALQLDFQQERVEETDSNKAGTLEVGYIYDGKVQWCQVTDSISNNIQLMFEEEGYYYLCVRNASSDRIIITNGSIQEKKIQEE